MAKFLRCDGCGQESPNENRLHVANEWLEIEVLVPAALARHDFEYKFHVCPECFGYGTIQDVNSGTKFPSLKEKEKEND